jgi:hypothetical protein
MIVRIAWAPKRFNGDWALITQNIPEEKVCDWATQFPDTPFFFVSISQDTI